MGNALKKFDVKALLEVRDVGQLKEGKSIMEKLKEAKVTTKPKPKTLRNKLEIHNGLFMTVWGESTKRPFTAALCRRLEAGVPNPTDLISDSEPERSTRTGGEGTLFGGEVGEWWGTLNRRVKRSPFHRGERGPPPPPPFHGFGSQWDRRERAMAGNIFQFSPSIPKLFKLFQIMLDRFRSCQTISNRTQLFNIL